MYESSSFEFLFEHLSKGIMESVFELLRHSDVALYRAKTIRSGGVLECELYPIWKCHNEIRKARAATTREAQKQLNAKNARKALVRKINANFTEADIAVTLTYEGVVPDEAQARRDIRNYLRRVRDYRSKHGLPALKYVYVIEFDNEDGGRAKKRIHHHVIMSGMDRDIAEQLWGKGRANAHRLQPDEYGLEAIARYMLKGEPHGKRWQASRNLKEPVITVSDHKLTKRQVERLAVEVDEAAPRIFAKLFPGYAFDGCEVRTSTFVAGAYVYARLHRDTAGLAGQKGKP